MTSTTGTTTIMVGRKYNNIIVIAPTISNALKHEKVITRVRRVKQFGTVTGWSEDKSLMPF